MGHGQVAVDGVAVLVGQGRQVVQRVLVVHLHVGMAAVDAGAEGAAVLVAAGIDVDPAVARIGPLLQQGHVLGAQGRQGRGQDLHGPQVGHVHLRGLDHGHVQVVEVQLVQTQHLAPQFDVAVQGLEVGVDGGDQVVVHRDGDVVLVQVRLQRGVVAAGAGVEDVQFELSGEDGGERVLELAQGGEERRHGLGAHLAVGRAPEAAVVGEGHLHLVALGVVHHRPGDVREQGPEGVLVAAGDLVEVDLRPEVVAGQLQQVLGLGRQHAALAAAQVLDVGPVPGQGRRWRRRPRPWRPRPGPASRRG